MRIMFDIKKVTIMTDLSGADKISIHTDLPSPLPIGVGNDYLIVDFEVEKGKGIIYAKQNFTHPFTYPRITLEHINAKTGEHRIIT